MRSHIKYILLLLFLVLIMCAVGCAREPRELRLNSDEQQALMLECIQEAQSMYDASGLWIMGKNNRGVEITNIAAAFFEYRSR